MKFPAALFLPSIH